MHIRTFRYLSRDVSLLYIFIHSVIHRDVSVPCIFTLSDIYPVWVDAFAGLILGLCPTNETHRYRVTLSLIGWAQTQNRADSRLAPSQWETSLQSNAVSHWLGANLESALFCLLRYFSLLYEAEWTQLVSHTFPFMKRCYSTSMVRVWSVWPMKTGHKGWWCYLENVGKWCTVRRNKVDSFIHHLSRFKPFHSNEIVGFMWLNLAGDFLRQWMNGATIRVLVSYIWC